jgi:hypothetical protein
MGRAGCADDIEEEARIFEVESWFFWGGADATLGCIDASNEGNLI